MKILLVSDVESKYLWDHFDKEKFKDINLIISCGDLKAEYLSFLVTVMNAPLLYVNGNHDGAFGKNPPEGCESIDGKLVNIKGLRILGLGGSIKYNGEGFQYSQREMDKRIRKMRMKIFFNKGFDILVTHAGGFDIGDAEDHCHRGFKGFNGLIEKYKPKYFFHGHTHLNYNARNVRLLEHGDTKVVNGYDYYIIEY